MVLFSPGNDPGDKPPEVLLYQAFQFQCPICGVRNFIAPIILEMDSTTREDYYRKFHNLEAWQELPEDWESFEIVASPSRVQCCNCSTTSVVRLE